MKKVFSNMKELLKEKSFLYPLIITCLLCFGYVLTHSTVNIDVLSYDRYFTGNELLMQGRFFGPLLEKIFHIYSFNPFFIDLLSVLTMAFSITFFCGFIKVLSNNKIKTLSYTIMSCLFISYPLLPEIFTYTPAGMNIGLGYFLIFLSVTLAYIYKDKNKIYFMLSFLPLLLAISMYESFASVYLLCIGIILYFRLDNKQGFKHIFKSNWLYAIPLILAIVVNTIISNLVIILGGLERSTNAAKTIYYTVYPFFVTINNLINSIKLLYIDPVQYYLPITILFISVILAIIAFTKKAFKERNAIYYLILLFILFCLFSLSFIQGTAAPYRTCQTFALFVGFIFLITTDMLFLSKKGFIKLFTISICFIIVFYQCKDMHKWFYLNDLRYQEEKELLIDIGNRLNSGNYDLSKPVIPIGYYSLSNNVTSEMYYEYRDGSKRKIGQTNINGYISWGNYAFKEAGTETLKLWKYLGYDFNLGTIELRNEAMSKIAHAYKNGEIIELDNCIIVCFK